MNQARSVGNPLWFKLRKQLLAQKSRVKKRVLIADSREEFEKREGLLKGALHIVKSNVSVETYQMIMGQCFEELPVLENTLMEAIGQPTIKEQKEIINFQPSTEVFGTV